MDAADHSSEFVGTDRFAIRRQLGEGGMGVVYEAVDRRTGGRVAVKTLKSLSAQALARLKTEFRALQEIEHPNLVSFGELVEADGHWFITMEMVSGQPLLEYVRARDSDAGYDDPLADTRDDHEVRAYDDARLRAAFGQLAAALIVLHDAGLVHRDIKPSNVLVTGEGRAVLLDFGLVRDLRGPYESLHDNVVGTVAYMAPEQAAGQHVTPAADWYAFGVALYEALTGTQPYTGSSLQVLLDKQRVQVVAPSRRALGVPDDLDRLCVQLLSFDPAARPDGGAILRALGAQPRATGASSSTFGTADELCGRAGELEQLRDCYRRARDGGPIAIVVRGESGLGKSVLVESFLADLRAGDDDVVVLAGRCYRNESVPFKAVDGVVDALAEQMLRMRKEHAAELVPRDAALLPQLFPTLGRVEVIARAPRTRRGGEDALEQRTRVFGALRELLSRVSDRRPLVIHIDDLHWSDDDSARLLDELLRPPDPPRLLLVATMRDGYPAPELPCPTESIELGPLAPEAARDLARTFLERVGAPPGADPAAIAEEARGHPLHIEELARHVADTGGGAAGSPKLDDAIWARINRLAPDARRLVELVAMATSPLPDDVFLTASELPAEEFIRCASMLRVGHLVRQGGSPRRVTLQPYHDRVRESVVARLDAAALSAHHKRLAIALELTREPDFERLAAHLLGAGERGRAIEVFRQAADEAMDKTAFAHAARLYQQSLDLLEPGDARAHDLHRALGDALGNAGRGPAAADAYRAALSGARGPDQLVLQRRIAEQLLRSGHTDEGLAAIGELAGRGGMKLAPTPRRALWRFVRLRARISLRGYRYRVRAERDVPASDLERIDTAWSLAEVLGFTDTIQGAMFHTIGVLAALRAGEPYRLVRAFAGEAINLSLRGPRNRRRYRRALEHLDRVIALEETPDRRAARDMAEALVCLAEGRFADCLAAATAAESAFRQAPGGHRFYISNAQVLQVWALSFLGRFTAMHESLPELLRDARDRGDRYIETTLAVSTGYYRALLDDRPADAIAHIDDALSMWTTRSIQMQHVNAMYGRIGGLLYAGDTAAAFAEVQDHWPDIERSLLLHSELMLTRLWELRGRVALARVGAGDGGARIWARRAVRALGKVRILGASGLRAMLEAGAAHVDGDRAAAVAALERAAGELGELGPWIRANDYALATLQDDRAGRARVIDEMAAEGARDPARFLKVYVPWLAVADTPA